MRVAHPGCEQTRRLMTYLPRLGCAGLGLLAARRLSLGVPLLGCLPAMSMPPYASMLGRVQIQSSNSAMRSRLWAIWMSSFAALPGASSGADVAQTWRLSARRQSSLVISSWRCSHASRRASMAHVRAWRSSGRSIALSWASHTQRMWQWVSLSRRHMNVRQWHGQ